MTLRRPARVLFLSVGGVALEADARALANRLGGGLVEARSGEGLSKPGLSDALAWADTVVTISALGVTPSLDLPQGTRHKPWCVPDGACRDPARGWLRARVQGLVGGLRMLGNL